MLLEGMLMAMLMVPPGSPQIRVEAIEVTQAIQDTANSVPLIANKRTVVRVYLNAESGWSVRGWLRVQSGRIDTTIRSMNILTIDPAMNGNPALKRSTINGSLNFLLPACEGIVRLEVTRVNDAIDAIPLEIDAIGRSIAVTFIRAPTLPLCIVAIPYKLTDGRVLMPRPVDYRLLRSWLQRAFPISELSIRHGYADTIYQNEDGRESVQIEARAWGAIASFGRADRELRSDKRTHYYGMVFDDGKHFVPGMNLRDGSEIEPPVSFGPTGAPAGAYLWDGDSSYGDWYGAHEIAHQFFRHHIGCGQYNTRVDTLYPYSGGFLSDSAHTYVGFDVGDPENAPEIPMRPLRGDIHHDIMSYSVDQWPSDYTYRAILNRLFEEEKNGELPVRHDIARGYDSSGSEPPVNQEEPKDDSRYSISVVCEIDTADGTGTIMDVTHRNRRLLSLSSPRSRITIRLLDATGQILKEHGVAVEYNSEDCMSGNVRSTMLIEELLPDVDAIDRIELRLDTLVLDTWHAAQLTVSYTTSAEISRTPTGVVVRWSGLAALTRQRQYRVEESLDGGVTWFLLAIERGSPGIELNRALYKNVRSVLLRVIEDGGNDSKEVVRTRVPL